MEDITHTSFTVDRRYGPEEIIEKRSRFISCVFPVKTRENANLILKDLRKKYHNATHVCSAIRLMDRGKESYFYNDDGEPSGTAGLPIYNEIKKKNFYNVLLVVVRYFRGIKLGTGGLARAYSSSAVKVLDISEKVEISLKKEFEVSFPFEFTGEMMQIVKRFSLEIINKDYTRDGMNMRISIPEEAVNAAEKKISDSSRGKIKLIQVK